MNTPNPLIPQGTFPDSRGKSHVRIAVFTIMAIHVVLLSALLMAGCKKTTDTTSSEPTNTSPAFEPATSVFAPAPPATSPPPVMTTQAVNVPPLAPVAPPSAETPIPPPVTASERDHVVVKGDSFYTLAKQYNVTTRAIAEANPGVDSTRLRIGQKVKIPAASSTTTAPLASNGSAVTSSGEKIYTVKSGDTLWKIAREQGVTEKALRTANNLRTSQIKVGQKLKIPSGTTTPAPEPISP